MSNDSPKLIFTQPEFAAQSCELSEGVTTVGRSSRNTLVIRDSSVSADHCEILVSWNEVIVREHGSRNGTWVNGVRVSGQRPVNHGETVRFGKVEARLELAEVLTDDATANTAHFALARMPPAQPAGPAPRAVVEPGDHGGQISIVDIGMSKPSPSPGADGDQTDREGKNVNY